MSSPTPTVSSLEAEGEKEAGFLPERVTGGCADAGPVPALARALAERDAAAAKCPLDNLGSRKPIGSGDCPVCGSGPSEPCWVKVRADIAFVSAARSALKEEA